MRNETFAERTARMESMRDMQVGDRVRVVESGRTGTVTRRLHPHQGWRVEWDEPQFGVTSSVVRTVHLERM